MERDYSTLKCIGAPTDAAGINLDRDILVDALVEAQQMRPERYTVLNDAILSDLRARYKVDKKLFKRVTGVLDC